MYEKSGMLSHILWQLTHITQPSVECVHLVLENIGGFQELVLIDGKIDMTKLPYILTY